MVTSVRNSGTANHDGKEILADDAATLKKFTGTHPQAISAWLPKRMGFSRPTRITAHAARQEHRFMLNWNSGSVSVSTKKHYKLVR